MLNPTRGQPAESVAAGGRADGGPDAESPFFFSEQLCLRWGWREQGEHCCRVKDGVARRRGF
eukprot:330105-Lingulodinium_polyedra.AAC.1